MAPSGHRTQDCSKQVCVKLALLLCRRNFHNIFSLYRYHLFLGVKGMFRHIYEPECSLARYQQESKTGILNAR